MAGRRGGKTVWLIAEAGVTCIEDHGYCGWAAPNFPILRDAWRDIIAEYAEQIAHVQKAEWTIEFVGGGRLECWSMDSGIMARGRKYHKFLIDEAGLVPNLGHRFDQEIEPTLGDYEGVLCAGSTPNLVSPDFLRWFQLGQTEHSGWKSWRWSSLDNPAVAPQMARRIEAARKRGVPEWIIQQEYFAVPNETMTGFFSRRTIDAHRAEYQCEPVTRGTLSIPLRYQSERDAILTHGMLDRIRWMHDPQGAWKLWFDVRQNRPDIRVGRPCMGVDIGCGVGSSNSVISAGDSDTGEKWAEYAYPGDSPEDLARLAAAFGWWIGGKDNPARINFEANGPGEQFIKVLLQLNYPNIHIRRKTPVKILAGSAAEYGWWNSHPAKFSLFSEYRSALATAAVINPSEAALDECLQYHVDKNNRVLHEREAGDSGEDESGAAIPHGDRVVADACLHQCMAANPISEQEQPPPPRGSVAWEEQRMAEEAAGEDA